MMRLADLRGVELRAQHGDLGHGEADVQRSRRGDVVLQVVHVELVGAQAGLDGVESLGLEAVELGAGLCGGHDWCMVAPRRARSQVASMSPAVGNREPRGVACRTPREPAYAQE